MIKQLRAMYRVSISTFLTVVLLIFYQFFSPSLVNPQEIRYPIPCYEGEELQKVREWEKTWVGKKINHLNVDQVRELLPEKFCEIVKNPQKWNCEEIPFEIVPYSIGAVSQGYIKATKKFAPDSAFEDVGYKASWGEVKPGEMLKGWKEGTIAGCPFPDPKTGLEIAWNYDSRTQGDGYQGGVFGEVVDVRTGSERHATQTSCTQYYTGRTDVEPTPCITPNKKKYRYASFLSIIEPVDVSGTRYMAIRYLDPTKDDESWMWVAMYRRIRRMATTQRQDTIDGSDQNYDDGSGIGGHIVRNTYKYLGRKEVLAVRHQDVKQLGKNKGEAHFTRGRVVERINAYMLEIQCKLEDYVYQKSVSYIDPETWAGLYKTNWDKWGRPWRFGQYYQQEFPLAEAEGSLSYVAGYTYCDLQRFHGSPSINKDIKVGFTLPKKTFTLQNLQKLGY